jgi:hypothetical protein
MKLLALTFVALAVGLLGASVASGSQLIDRNANGIRLLVNPKGEAMVTYQKGAGATRRVLAWGGVDARQPAAGTTQVAFKLDYSGGWGKYKLKNYWQTFGNRCGGYDGPDLANFVTGCRAPDGSLWAVQSWQVPLPDLGFAPWIPKQSAYELHLSHWTGPLATLEVSTDWVWSGRFRQLFGRVLYDQKPVFGFGTTSVGAPTDHFGRLIYVDTLDAPAYGSGWRRENSFVAHNPTGVFCYGFFSFDPTKGGYMHPPGQTAKRGPGIGSQYRLTVNGPGVTPDVQATATDPGAFDPASPTMVAYEKEQNAALDSLGDKLCRQH